MRFQTLNDWLDWQTRLHPEAIELGLDRVADVWRRLYPKAAFPFTVITVAGTNGKGSCVAMLDAILRAAGYRTGCYTSPHLLRYNERIQINGAEATDTQICESFERVDQARRETSLTYFEFGTLAALDIFAAGALDIVILEVGLGGRLDAVNIIDPDVALITSVDLDHTDWLGDSRDQIALEKAGILRPGRPGVFGGIDPPASLLQHAQALGAALSVAGTDYQFQEQGAVWDWWAGDQSWRSLPRPALRGRFQLQNAAAVLAVLTALGDAFPVGVDAISEGLQSLRLPGRFQVIPGPVTLVLDVAHNPAAAQVLADNLKQTPCAGRTLAVFAVLAGKDMASMVQILAPWVDRWHVGAVSDQRTLSTQEMRQCLSAPGIRGQVVGYEHLSEAYAAARSEAVPGDRLLVFGSFLTVAAVLNLL